MRSQRPSSRYGIYRCDIRERCDRLIREVALRVTAVKIVQKLNAKVIEKHGGTVAEDGKPVPLYYCVSRQYAK